jgi:hypothetical protein
MFHNRNKQCVDLDNKGKDNESNRPALNVSLSLTERTIALILSLVLSLCSGALIGRHVDVKLSDQPSAKNIQH